MRSHFVASLTTAVYGVVTYWMCARLRFICGTNNTL